MLPQERYEPMKQVTDAQFAGELPPDELRAWEEVAAGRFMPRRIKGSCKGRALG
jgi:hypothetical protein